MVNSKPIISCTNIEKTFTVSNNSNKVLKDITFELYPNELVFLCGSNGSGKSTLLNILSFEVDTDNHPDFKYLNDKSWKENYQQQLVYLPQKIDHALTNSLKIFEYFKLFDKNSITELIKQLDIEWLNESYYNKKKSKLIGELSFGQKQLLLGIALLSSSKSVLLLDEVFSSMDRQNRNLFLSLIRYKISTINATCLVVSHDYRYSYENGDRILILKNGLLIEFYPEKESYDSLIGFLTQ